MANCNYKVNIKDIQSKYSFKIFCAGDNAEVKAEIGNLEDLTTTAKNNLVSAINEVHSDTETNATAISDLQSGKEDKSNKVTSISSASTDTQYPSAKCVYDSQVAQDTIIEGLDNELDETKNELEATKEELDYYKTIYNVLPKVEGNGESITLDNTGESILKLDPRGQCKQDTTNGNNLIDTRGGTTTTINGITFTPTYNSQGELQSIKVNGTATDRADFIFPNYLTLQAGTYYLSKQSSNSVYLLIVDSGGSSYATSSLSESEFTLSADKSVRLWLRVFSGVSIDNAILYPMVAKTSGATYEPFTYGASPNPSYPQQIHEVSGDNGVKVVGKNLLGILQQGGLNNGSETSSTNRVRTDFIQVKSNEKYTISNLDTIVNQTGISFYDENKNFISAYSSGGWVGTPVTITTLENAKYIRIMFRNTSNADITPDLNYKIMLNEGNTAATYEPYNGDTYELDLGVENLVNAMQESFTLPASETTYQKIISNTSADNKVHLVANTKYYISYTIENASTSNTRSTPRLYLDSSNYYQKTETNRNITAGRKVEEYTPTTTGDYSVEYWLQGSNVDVVVSDYMISTENGSYTPYGQTPIKMRGIGTYEDYFVRNSGKNLFDKSKVVTGTLEGDGSISYSDYKTSDYILVKPNTAYYKSVTNSARFKYYDNNKNRLSNVYNDIPSAGDSQTFTTPANAYYIRFSISSTTSLDSVMINEGSTALPYEPYGTGQWCKYNAVGKKTLVGTETIDMETMTGKYLFKYNTYDMLQQNNGLGLSNYFTRAGTQEIGTVRFGWINRVIYMYMDSNYSTVELFKTWLSTHNTELIFPLGKPYLSLIENETLISQLDIVEKALAKQEQTNISQINNDIPFKIYASALKEIE